MDSPIPPDIIRENNGTDSSVRALGIIKISRFRRWGIRFLVAAIVALGVGYLPYKAYGPQGIARALRLENDLKQLQKSNQAFREENEALLRQIKSLKEDPSAIEQVAREELGLVKAEDIVFQFE
jgi:cell division protein FtsB